MKLGTQVGLSPGHIVLDGDPAPHPQKGAEPPPNFRPISVVAKWLDGWMPLGREVGLSQSDIVLDGDSAPPPPKGAEPPIFGPRLLWPNGWMDQDTTWYRGRPQPKRHCVRWGPSCPSPKTGRSPRIFGPCPRGLDGWMDKDATWPEGSIGLGPGHIVLDEDPAHTSPKGGGAPNFRSISVVAKWLDGSRCHLVRSRPQPRPQSC